MPCAPPASVWLFEPLLRQHRDIANHLREARHLADHHGLAAVEGHLVDAVVGGEPGRVGAVRRGRDVEGVHLGTGNAELADRFQRAVVGLRLLDQRADRGVDVVERRLLGLAEGVRVGGRYDRGLLAFVHVALLEGEADVLGHLAALDVDAQVGAVGAHEAQLVGHRIEIDDRPRRLAGQLLVELGHLARLARRRVDGDDGAIYGDAVEHLVGRPHVDAEQASGAAHRRGLQHLAGVEINRHERIVPHQGDGAGGLGLTGRERDGAGGGGCEQQRFHGVVSCR